MSTAAPNPTRQNRNRLVVAVFALIAILLTVGGFLLYRAVRHEARFDKPDLLYDYMVFGPSSETQALKRRDAFVEEAKKIRAGLEPWAREHKDLLARMQRAPKGDAAIFEEVYAAAPEDSPHPVGFRSIADLDDKTKTIFSYNISIEKGTSEAARARRASTVGYVQGMFDRYQDIPIAGSVNSGSKSIILWVSGRITESTFKIDTTQKGKSLKYHGDPVELLPPYDFLR